MTAPFFIINVFALSSLSKFTDYSAVRIAKHIPNPQHIEGQIRLNSYTVGSGRNKSHYEDVVLNEPSQQQPLRLVCNFMNRFKSCPLLENFQQQKVSIRYYTDSRQFIYPEVLVLSVTADNTTISSQDFMQIYQQQRKQFFDVFILHGIDSKPVGNQFILARPSISTITNFSLSTSKHFSAYHYQHTHSLSSKTIGAYALSMRNQYAFFD